MRRRIHRLLAAALCLLPLLVLPAPGAAGAPGPAVTVSPEQAGTGGDITVRGTGWRPNTLLTLLLCGQNAIGGTNSCANAHGRAVTTDARGAFRRAMPVAEPPKPCPCVVHVATVTGERAVVDAPFVVAGHPTAPLPEPTGGRLSVLSARLDGSGGLLTWFGAPPGRRLVLTVGNLGSGPVQDPAFRVGTSHGLFAPQWEDRAWQGTVRPGAKARVELPVQLAAGAHGDYTVTLEYAGKVLVTEPWDVSRPWGVTLFWVLLCVVVPAALFRLGMAVVDRVRPRAPGPLGPPPGPPPALPWFSHDHQPQHRTAEGTPWADGTAHRHERNRT
ncbi:hypothetical protein [Streptomyces sp. NPDC026673]|uniref:hypothetical protein n=1 Tax=Streptomyces sp. NPDC026673 TaxID=3155724 RepID=UPI0033EFA37E